MKKITLELQKYSSLSDYGRGPVAVYVGYDADTSQGRDEYGLPKGLRYSVTVEVYGVQLKNVSMLSQNLDLMLEEV